MDYFKERQNRYTFGGFNFGDDDHRQFNLIIKVINNSNHGTSVLANFEIELTDIERQELISLLLNTKDAE